MSRYYRPELYVNTPTFPSSTAAAMALAYPEEADAMMNNLQAGTSQSSMKERIPGATPSSSKSHAMAREQQAARTPRPRAPPSVRRPPPIRHSAGPESLKVGSPASQYTRAQRAGIRQMYSRGYSIEEIKSIMNAAHATITSIIGNRDLSDKVSEDWEYADANFLQSYPPKVTWVIPSKRTSETRASLGSPVPDLPTLTKSAASPGRIHKTVALPQRKRTRHSASPSQLNLSQTTGSHIPETQRLLAPDRVESPRQDDTHETAAEAPATEMEHAPQIGAEAAGPADADSYVPTPSLPDILSAPDRFVTGFLANLDVDMSAHHAALVACNLGSARDVVSRREWPAKWFNIIFERDVPALSLAERAVLTRGFKSISEDGTIVKGITRLDEVPQIWTTPIAGFLSKLAVSLAQFLPAFQRAGFGTLGTLLATAGWPKDDLRALYDVALPELKAIHHFVLMRALEKLDRSAPTLNAASLENLTAVHAAHATPGSVPAPPGLPLVDFLRNLDHDLSYRAPLLLERGLASIDDLSVLRTWPAEALRDMLRDIAPELTNVEHFVLVRGIKASTPDEPIPEKGPIRVSRTLLYTILPPATETLLDANPDLWHQPVSGLLADATHDLSAYVPLLERAGFNTSRALVAIAGWADGDLLSLLEEVVPHVSTTMRFTLIAAMKKGIASMGER
ncbi:hypothetical protein HDZ31DRAFT_62365 [Schizophyllum fasciatum]